MGKHIDSVLQAQHIAPVKTAAVHSRINPVIKQRAEAVLEQLGLSPTEAIRMFYTQIALRKGLPFEVKIPNSVTQNAMEDSRRGQKLRKHESVDELFASWDA